VCCENRHHFPPIEEAGVMKEYAKSICVARTPYGHGVFALKRFRRGETVGAVTGEVIDDPDYGSDYCIDLGPTRVLEPEPPFSYLNHSCEPNCQLVTVAARNSYGGKSRWKIILDTIRAIRTGDQLTIDYSWPADAAIPCLCGSPTCRGWIVNEEELHLLPTTPPALA